jgi:hypothetical protein
MKTLALIAILAAAAGLIVYKVSAGGEATAPTPQVAQATAGPRVLMYVDLGEINEEHGCGEIIHLVRDAATHGVAIRENDDALGKAHRVTVSPTVVILDAQGQEEARYEGESQKTVDALRAHLSRLQANSR